MLTSRRAGPLSGTIRVPGDKSISHRALMIAALAIGQTPITGLLEGEDVLRTADAMRALGARITRVSPTQYTVQGAGLGALREPEDILDMGNSGTAARLLCGILASHPIVSTMTGDASLRRRPMARVTAPLAETGARFTARAGVRLPLTIEGAANPLPIEHRLTIPSAQVKSALLLAGLNARGTTRIEEPTPTRDHTEHMLRHFGARITTDGPMITLEGQPTLRAAPIAVPGDPSSAAFPIIAALIVPGSRITIEQVGLNPTRTGLLTTLREMGADLAVGAPRIEAGEPVGDITASHGVLRAIETPPERAPFMIDEYPILAVACAHAAGISRLRGLGELRVKESDRLAATAALLHANGIRAEIEGDDLIVHGVGGPPPGGGEVATHMDHRLAMSALILGAATVAAVTIDDAAFIDTSFPGFVALMNGIGCAFA
jgi:3-phosphoshikimate 1-carboxyvinyltransferase